MELEGRYIIIGNLTCKKIWGWGDRLRRKFLEDLHVMMPHVDLQGRVAGNSEEIFFGDGT